MDISQWHIWIIIAIILLIIEAFTPTFLAACLAIGCITSGVFSYLDFGFKGQLLAFSIGTLTGFFGIRPFMFKYIYKNANNNTKTNVDALVGKTGKVLTTIDSNNNGRVKIEGEDWRAETDDDTIINVDEKVEVLRINSNILIVKKTT